MRSRRATSTTTPRVDVEAVRQFLSTEPYWNRWRTRSDVERQVQSAWSRPTEDGVSPRDSSKR